MTTHRLRYIKNGKIVTKEFNTTPVTKKDEAWYEKISLEIKDAYDKGLVK
jgi:hypothetical protein